MGGAWEIEEPEDIWHYHVRPWIYGAQECAVHLESMLALERHILGEIDRDEMERQQVLHEDLGHPFSFMMPNQAAMIVTTLSCDDQHLFTRFAVALILDGMAGKALPQTLEEALQQARERCPGLLPEEETPEFRYVLLAPDRFRLAVRWRPENIWSELDDPPSERPLEMRPNLIEVQVPVEKGR